MHILPVNVTIELPKILSNQNSTSLEHQYFTCSPPLKCSYWFIILMVTTKKLNLAKSKPLVSKSATLSSVTTKQYSFLFTLSTETGPNKSIWSNSKGSLTVLSSIFLQEALCCLPFLHA
ncbi:hypothetical protein Tco_0635274, partial [Tanacetum coccineum]